MTNQQAIIKRAPLLLLGAMLLAAPAQSASIGASSGAAYTPSQASCFVRDGLYTRVRVDAGVSGCSSGYWNTDVENHETGTVNHAFYAYGQSAGTSACPINPSACQTTCAAIVAQSNGALSAWTGHMPLLTSPGWRLLGNLVVSGGLDQGIQYECLLKQGGYVSSFRGF